MRRILLATAAILAAGTAYAETITTFTQAAGQPALDLGAFQSTLPGAKPLHLTVGIGSAAFRDPAGPADTFYTISDRGANFTCDDAKDVLGLDAEAACPAVEGIKAGAGRLYPRPDDVLSIYTVKLDPAAKTFTVTDTLPLKTPKGAPIVGLTNPLTVATTEKPRDGNGQPLKQNINSIDAEGLVRLADGRFFVAEENATGIVEISPDGTIVRRFVPAGTEMDFATADYPVSGAFPAILAKRHSNRGLESLSVSDDGKYLYTMVQNPLDNPDSKAYGKALNTRLFKLEIGKDASGATTLTPVAEYVYQLGDFAGFAALGATDAKKPSDLRISEMTALGHEHFLVDERTDQIAKLFEIDLAGATNILGTKWDDAATSPTLEQSNDLKGTEIVPVAKTERLVASSLEGAAVRYPAKIEGLALTADGKLFMINDNDFGISGADTVVTIVEGTEIGPR
ncbi:esterase-like activity of phytase family protein [Kaistia dalseonensis]|uniref:Phytase-like domain-containing protein n=1 Tax=Kaistia dalseonensis TaxID=410840 RepID=A0ABU0HA35_9HYPH|nr:esterase-like activity of phytase family protein [Kaistia dalseonensis]MCX5496549.1 esterase-like activity of phytase family protein [Kaistia dalseonensis]MDQ0439171.1 hypothetical protein [Kaistia dalseonensis]